jgi:hypothetical protein
MPTDISKTLGSLLSAKATVNALERRFLKQLRRALPNGLGRPTKMAAASTRRTLKCPKCPRRFARPVHLGRHLSATHGLKRKKRA